MQGILLIDKPSGWTSFDVVNYVRRIVADAEDKRPKTVKVGHTGTLDPFATGLLILLIGKTYTRRANELSKLDKSYEVSICLGKTSNTGDPEGIIEEQSAKIPPEKVVREAVEQFMGCIEQVPPAYSAIKINGQRAYKLAREGKTVIIEPRSVTITKLEVASYRYPNVQVIADVSSGTYIRALTEDIGRVLGTGAYTTQLCRTRVGQYRLEQSCSVDGLDGSLIEGRLNTF